MKQLGSKMSTYLHFRPDDECAKSAYSNFARDAFENGEFLNGLGVDESLRDKYKVAACSGMYGPWYSDTKDCRKL
ncbi:MAG: hypothetical protein A2328_01975 [Bdellovibrionales bacterium RIFOXYB2_FULL_36_6]|nr:MAG: hypothetical protein A2328_01975 [Bdellovibrionales bacterium RIFOXYB2_FULL_36_6]